MPGRYETVCRRTSVDEWPNRYCGHCPGSAARRHGPDLQLSTTSLAPKNCASRPGVPVFRSCSAVAGTRSVEVTLSLAPAPWVRIRPPLADGAVLDHATRLVAGPSERRVCPEPVRGRADTHRRPQGRVADSSWGPRRHLRCRRFRNEGVVPVALEAVPVHWRGGDITAGDLDTRAMGGRVWFGADVQPRE